MPDELRAQCVELAEHIVQYQTDHPGLYAASSYVEMLLAFAQAERAAGLREAKQYCDDCEAAERKLIAQSNSREFILAFHKAGYWCEQRAKELEATASPDKSSMPPLA